MICQDIIKLLEVVAPPEYALDWDNSGLLTGNRKKDIRTIVIGLDATDELCDEAIRINADMLITHHPMIFSPLKSITEDTALGSRLIRLIKNDIVCYAMHTNYDTKGGMAKHAADMLGLKNCQVLEETMNGEGIGQIGILDNTMTTLRLGEKVKEVFGLKNVMIYGNEEKEVDKIAVCPGSGKSVINIAAQKGATCLITGDIGHHEGIDAVEMGMNIIDASHYGLEKIFINNIYKYLKEYCADVEIVPLGQGAPFCVI